MTDSLNAEEDKRAALFANAFVAAIRGLGVPDPWRRIRSERKAAKNAFVASRGESWDRMRAAFLSSRLTWDDSNAPLGFDGALPTRCARIAFAYATGEAGLIRHDEGPASEAVALALGVPTLPSPAPEYDDPAPPTGDGSVPIEVAFASPTPSRPGAKRSQIRASIDVPLRGADRSQTEVAFVLTMPDDGELEVVCMDGEFYRPVLAPGLWKPIDLGRFRAAMRTGEAWGDMPHRPGFRMHAGVKSPIPEWLDDCATQRAPATSSERDLLTQRETRVRALCAGLMSMDGGVWTRIEAPRARVLRPVDAGIQGNPRKPIVATWQAGKLSPLIPQATIRPLFNALDLFNTATDSPPCVADFPISLEGLARAIAIRLGGSEADNAEPLAKLSGRRLLPSPAPRDFLRIAELADAALPLATVRWVIGDECEHLAYMVMVASKRFRGTCETGDIRNVAETAIDLADAAYDIGIAAISHGRTRVWNDQLVAARADDGGVTPFLDAINALAAMTSEAASLTKRLVSQPEYADEIADAFDAPPRP